MAINLRSPYYVGSNILTNGYNVYRIYIYDAYPLVPPLAYTIRKNYNANFEAGKIEVSELIRDYLDVYFREGYESYNSQALRVQIDFDIYDSNGNIDSDGDYGLHFAFDSYSYFEENDFDVDNNPIMISNRQIFALADNLVRIPINATNSSTVTFLKNGEVLSSQNISPATGSAKVIQYLTVNGESIYDNFKERVLFGDYGGGGIFEETKCLTDFLEEFEIGEIDEIRVSSDDVQLDVIKVKVLDECKYEPKKVTFVNKFGALQDMYFFKKAVEKMDVKKETYKANIISNGAYNRSDHVNREFNVVGKESVTLSSGFLNEEYNEVFKQMMLSEKVWITNLTDTEEQILPINVKTSNITYKTSLNDRLVEYTFEFDNSYDTINNIR